MCNINFTATTIKYDLITQYERNSNSLYIISYVKRIYKPCKLFIPMDIKVPNLIYRQPLSMIPNSCMFDNNLKFMN